MEAETADALLVSLIKNIAVIDLFRKGSDWLQMAQSFAHCSTPVSTS